MDNIHRSPVLFMRGRGLGNILGRLVRGVIPFFIKRRGAIVKGLKTAGRAASKAAVHAAHESLQDNTSFAQNLKKAGRKELGQLVQNATTLVDGQQQNQRRSGTSRAAAIKRPARSAFRSVQFGQVKGKRSKPARRDLVRYY